LKAVITQAQVVQVSAAQVQALVMVMLQQSIAVRAAAVQLVRTLTQAAQEVRELFI
jgi:hypothetical protein